MTVSAGPRSVAIVGGGITGLATAYLLAKHSDPPTEISLFEAGARFGGKIRTVDFAGGHIEAGPDSFVAREPWVEDLCRELGLSGALVEPAVFGAAVWVDRRLRRFPAASVWGLPATPVAALGAEALSPRGKVRALGDLVLPGTLRGPDVSVRDLVERRFGREVLNRLVDPLLAGTKAGSVDDTSLAAALPQIDSLARGNRSIMRAARRARRGSLPRFLSLAGGMQRLVEALTEALAARVDLRADAPVTRLNLAGDRYELVLGNGELVEADAVALCAPAPATAALLEDVAPDAADVLREIDYAPVASIALRYPVGAFEVPEGTSGVLVPRTEPATISACTWWSTKWPNAGKGGGLVVRCFVGRTTADHIPTRDDDLIAACVADIRGITGTAADPTDSSITRWPDGLPHYRVGHLERLAAVTKSLPRDPPLALAGAGYRGSGLTDCVAQARVAARQLLGSRLEA